MTRILSLVAALALLAGGAHAAVVAEYRFDGSGADSSGNGEDLTLYDGAGYAPGILGQALMLDGVNAHAYSGFSYYNLFEFTLEAWIKAPSFAQNAHYITLSRGVSLALGDAGANDVLARMEGLSPADAGAGLDSALTPGQWHHLAYSFDGSQQRVYIDGVLMAAVASGGSPVFGDSGLVIGAGASRSGGFFTGYLDNVRISDRALAASELGYSTDLAAPVPLPAGGLLLVAALAGLGLMRRRG